MEISKSKLSALDIALIPLFTALIYVGAFIKIPIGLVPVSCQTVMVLLAGFILGARRAFLAVLLYIILGLAGLPVFVGGGGLVYVFTPTFGYIIGMLIAATVVGYLSQRNKRRNFLKNVGVALLGLAIIYGVGFSYLVLILSLTSPTPPDAVKLFKPAVLVFLPQDTLWCLIAALIAKRLAPVINRL